MTDDAAKKLDVWATAHATGEMKSPIAVGVLELLMLRSTAQEVAVVLRDFASSESGACNDHVKGILNNAADELEEAR
jgi:hypothetical protein